ncbi:biliverdin-producing heme oxygenase [Arenimonas composti]|uniref:biliverdin-producing heme oxygenase n=1 Tax=Arenimonas composti TaxID=370776 RepID=UPI0012B541EF|nr:biliverdin-producing heme oxygenase [Arenimonas composti]
MPDSDLRTLLRESTRARHARVDALFGEGFTGREGYAAYLLGMRALLSLLLPRLPELAPLLPLLEDDLRSIAADSVVDTETFAADAIETTAPTLPDSEAQRLGWRYVIHGSSLGARVLQRQAAALGASPDHGARFLAAHAQGDGWRALFAALTGSTAPPAEVAAVLAAADAAFAAAEAAFRRAIAAMSRGVPA